MAEKEGIEVASQPLSCYRKNLRVLCTYPRFFRTLRQFSLPSSAAGGGRGNCPRLRRSGSASIFHQNKKPPTWVAFVLAEKEGIEVASQPLSCYRKNLRVLRTYPRFFRTLRQFSLPSSAAGGGRGNCPRLRRSGSASIFHQNKNHPHGWLLFWRRKRELNYFSFPINKGFVVYVTSI